MPIFVQCDCGGKFQARDELAGKRLNCPNCKTPIQVPSRQVNSPENPPASRPATPSAGGPIALQCQCGQKFKVKRELAGKKASCPKCQTQFTIPAGKPAPNQAAASPAAAAGKLKVQCQCGQIYSVPANMAGRGVKCQKCGASMKVPGNSPAPSQTKATAANSLDDPLGMGGLASDDLFADDPLGGDFGDDLGNDALGSASAATAPAYQPGNFQPPGAAPAQPTGGSKMNLPMILGIAGGGGGLLLLLVCGIGGYFMFFSGGSGDPIVATTDGNPPAETDGSIPPPVADGSSPDPTADGTTPVDTGPEEPTPDPPGDDSSEFAQDIVGMWQLTLVDGKKGPSNSPAYVILTDETFQLVESGAPPNAVRYSLDVSKSPVHFDIIPDPRVPMRIRGLVQLNNDQIDICLNKPSREDPIAELSNRPADFQIGEKSKVLSAERITDPKLLAKLEARKKPPAEPVARNYLNDGKQFALGVLNYYDVYRTWPRNIANQQGEPLLSWRVAVLPFLEHDTMYEQFDREASWDQPDNKVLANRTDLYKTEYSNSQAETPWRYIPDTKTGIMLVLGSEDGPQVIWTQPDEIHPDLNNLKTTFGTPPDEGYLVILTNGAAQRMSEAELKTALAKAETWDMKGKPR